MSNKGFKVSKVAPGTMKGVPPCSLIHSTMDLRTTTMFATPRLPAVNATVLPEESSDREG